MIKFIFSILFLVTIFLAIAFFTLAERKVLAAFQLRQGPNVIGVIGSLQPFADALKLFSKETIKPTWSNKWLFLFSPIIALTLALVCFSVLPIDKGIYITDLNIGLFFILSVSSLSVYAILCSGWASNSQYALLGALRSTAQIISYEVSIGFLLISIILSMGTINITQLVLSQKWIWNIISFIPVLIIYFVSVLAETNRSPFDLPEGESELVSGFHVEYSSITFAIFFLAEYTHIIFTSFIITLLFLGGWLIPFNLVSLSFITGPITFTLKSCFVIFSFIWIRATLPRYRYDQLISLLWKSFIPLCIAFLIFYFSFFQFLNLLPPF